MLGSLLLSVSFALPFMFDAGSFAVAAGLVFLIAGQYRAPKTVDAERRPWNVELAEGVRWLRGHELLWPMAIILGLLNAIGMMTYVDVRALRAGGAGHVGSHVRPPRHRRAPSEGSWAASPRRRISRTIGAGPSLALTMAGGAAGAAVLAVTSSWPVAWLAFGVEASLGSLWNVITVSLRQAIIPDHLLGRVNSVYRFLGWGMMPIGSLVGALVVAADGPVTTREIALRTALRHRRHRQPGPPGLRHPPPHDGQDRGGPGGGVGPVAPSSTRPTA